MKTTPALTAALWVAVCLATNGFIFALGWNDNQTYPLSPSWKPPGWVIGLVWMVLFACMGLAHGLLLKQENRLHWGYAALLVACLSYPFYTGGLQNGPPAYWGTMATLAGVLALMLATPKPQTIRWLLLPVALWLCFAAVLIHTTLKLNGVTLCA
jgi:tryptophan-rich sensory protein